MISRRVWSAFALLCLVSGTAWAIPPDETLPALEQQSLIFAISAVAALCFRPRRAPLRHRLQVATAGIGFFGVPIAVVHIARGSLGETTRTASFAIVPVVVILAVVASEDRGGARRLLMPALLGLGGLLLILPLQFSSSARGLLMLALVAGAVLIAGLCSVWMFHLLQGTAVSCAMLTLGAANAVFLLGCAAARGERTWSLPVLGALFSAHALVDFVAIPVIVWLLREMPPTRFSARYLLIPWVTIVESLCLTRPAMTPRMAFGLVFLTAGAGMVLLLKEAEPDSALSLR